jgi:hypothetical protein
MPSSGTTFSAAQADLEIPKCVYHLAHYGFTAACGSVLKSLPSTTATVSIQERSKQPTPLQYLSPYTARKTLGCYRSPSNNFKTSRRHVTENALQKANTISNSFITTTCAHRYYYSIFLPSVTYSFPTNTIPEHHLRHIQNKSTRPILNKMGYAKSTPHALYDEQGSSKMELVLTLSSINTSYHPIADRHGLVPENEWYLETKFPEIPLPHLETSFFPSLREYS